MKVQLEIDIDTNDKGAGQAILDHLFGTFNDDNTMKYGRVLLTLDDNAQPVWSDELNAWTCPGCGGTELTETEDHPVDYRISDGSTNDNLLIITQATCCYEAAMNDRLHCSECSADLAFPEGVSINYD